MVFAKSRLSFLTPVFVAVAFCFVVGLCVFALAHTEENDAFCASCHSQPETTFVSRAQASAAMDLASAHAMLAHTKPQAANTRCIDCHSGPGALGRASSLSLGARDAIRWFTGTAIQPARQTTAIADANCLKCHANTPTASNFDNHFHHELARWQQADATAATCATCHTSHTTDGNATIGFLAQSRAQAECKRCHVALRVEQ